MVSIDLGSILSSELFGEITNSLKIKHIRISPLEFSFNNSFSNAFAIGENFKLGNIAVAILNGSILSLETFGEFTYPKEFFLYGIPSSNAFGLQTLDALYLYGINTVLYIVDEAKHQRLEKVGIKKIYVQNVTSVESMINNSNSSYRMWRGDYYSIIYEDTLGRYWEESELTRDPESFFGWYELQKTKIPARKATSISSLGKRKKSINWSKSKLFSKKMAEKGVLHQIKIKKASVRNGNMLVYFDEKNNLWEENELVFETMASLLIKKYKERET